ncbi:hypothetical protein FA95DRAFT_1555758 [Auriscalpium vulgare]|uniref:Uncharacterized protein n=1 Tax=Auriscalpium vulgare TaxID=40419 RepID=A0ACB8S3Q5_9AGAM|nr:hypothetical protein FA95DRAFT_1555758 [Auriscalpium vulgare]
MATHSKHQYTAEEKQQLLANLDIEVAHRTRQLEAWLADTLAAFRSRHERQIAYIPHLVRGVSMGDFGDKYAGDVQACLRGLQKAHLDADGVGAPLDRGAMKRKWGGADEEGTAHEARAPVKNARIMSVTPQKKPSFTTGTAASRSRVASAKTPGTIRPASPHKPMRPASPSKLPTSPSKSRPRPPSSASFAPALPKTPAYPPRWPRRDESMLSVNGSPLTNPYVLGLDWLGGQSPAQPDAAAPATGDERAGTHTRTLSRSNSGIVIRRDASFASLAEPSQTTQLSTLTPAPRGHVRSVSHSQLSLPSHSRSNSQHSAGGISASGSGHVAARVAVPTRDGAVLEFDPLLTSPAALDKLEGLSASAKKQAKEDMRALMQAAVAKWNLS